MITENITEIYNQTNLCGGKRLYLTLNACKYLDVGIMKSAERFASGSITTNISSEFNVRQDITMRNKMNSIQQIYLNVEFVQQCR